MLTLSRKPKQAIQVGENITITVISVKGQKVRLAVEAPKNVGIRRSEKIVVDASGDDDVDCGGIK